jgi:cadmium resistance protein CadD (predicted permease)
VEAGVECVEHSDRFCEAVPYQDESLGWGVAATDLGSARRRHRLAREHRSRTAHDTTDDDATSHGVAEPTAGAGPGVLTVATLTLANGGDNIGVYVPVFTTTSVGGLLTYIAVFLLLVALWCLAGHYLARRPFIAGALSRWGHILLPAVLISIGLIILIQGHAFGL